MNKTQEERLNYLLEEFKADSDKYKNIEIPDNIIEKRNLLRSLMNIRMPKKMPDEVIKVQETLQKLYAWRKPIRPYAFIRVHYEIGRASCRERV